MAKKPLKHWKGYSLDTLVLVVDHFDVIGEGILFQHQRSGASEKGLDRHRRDRFTVEVVIVLGQFSVEPRYHGDESQQVYDVHLHGAFWLRAAKRV